MERYVCRPLIGHRSPHMPWVAVGYQAREFEHVSSRAARDEGLRASDLEREAVRNLRVRQLEWAQSTLSLGFLKKLTMLTCQGDPLAAEKVLDLGFLRQAHAKLRADELLAGIPYRGMLTVTDARAGADRVAAFARLVVRDYAEAGKDYVSPAVFRISGGTVFAIDDSYAEEDLPQFAGRIKDEVDPGSPTVSASFVRPRGEDRDEILVEAGGTDAERLVEAITDAVATLLMQDPDHPSFGGNVRVKLIGNLTPQSTRARMTDLEGSVEQLDGQAARLSPHRPLKAEIEVDGIPW